MPYALITVTHSGEVHHSRGYETLRMCQQARSVALYGMTIEEKIAQDQREAEQLRAALVAQAEAEAQYASVLSDWLATTFPPRRPNAAEQAAIARGITRWPTGDQSDFQLYDPVRWFCEIWRLPFEEVRADGLIHPLPERRIVYNRGRPTGEMRSSYPLGDAKSAHCVIEMPDAPEAMAC